MIITRTPLRISFFGGGTDYPAWFATHPGAVLVTSIDKYIYVTLRYLPPFFDHTIRLTYSKMENVSRVDDIVHPSIRECLRLLEVHSNVELHTDADLPGRTGLGSSSTFTVGLLNALHAYRGRLASKLQLAKEAIHVEQDLLGEHVGCQDQTVAAHGGLIRIDFGAGAELQISPVPQTRQRLAEFERHLLLLYTGIPRRASPIAAQQIRSMADKERELHEMYGMVDEGVRLLTTRSCWQEFGALLHEGWRLKRSLSACVSNPTIDAAYALARQHGAYGGKLLGAGAGGFLLIVADPDDHPAIRQVLAPFLYVPVRLESGGTQIVFYQPDGEPYRDDQRPTANHRPGAG